ncbi:hypothetical protein UFOVP298_18 [uncultured Caudovirales phage]|uniref:Uncharacterized protein n=1 Tax=uncultured Caudovirales phage TaxID=2100421 RepID=A0A6J5LST5_9CAUD|nr:hypothetical protein UFOVP298_18 [uncultured Caudovirales phage]CAB4150730.1 hypothetical protein UFOVP572_21 [uncultured Caudovirales phage]
MKIPKSFANTAPFAPANTTQFIPEEVRPMVEARQKHQAQQQAAFQKQLFLQKENLEKEYLAKQAEVDNEVASVPEEDRKYPAFVYDAKRLKTINDLDYARRITDIETAGLPAEMAERKRKLTEDRLKHYEVDTKPLEETPMWKTANENFRAMDKLNQRVSGISSLINTTKSLFEEGKPDMALEHMKTNVAKALNSLQSDDAIQMSEILFRYKDLLSFSELTEMGGLSALNPVPYFNAFIKSRNESNQAGMEKAQQGFDKILEKMYRSNPKRFLETAISGANSYLNSYNDQLDNKVINVTSPGVARDMGAVKFNPITPLQENEPTPMPKTFPRAASVPSSAASAASAAVGAGQPAGTMQPIQRPAIGGSPDQFTPPQQQQQQPQPAPVPVEPAPAAPVQIPRDSPTLPLNQYLDKYLPKQ